MKVPIHNTYISTSRIIYSVEVSLSYWKTLLFGNPLMLYKQIPTMLVNLMVGSDHVLSLPEGQCLVPRYQNLHKCLIKSF